MVFWHFAPIKPAWLDGEGGARAYFTHPLILLGIGAFAAYELLFFTSLGSFRQRWYEIFLASHVVLQVVALVFLYLHFHTARPYVLASLAIFLVDRVAWRFGLKSTTMTTDLTVLPDGETIILSANWDKPASKQSWFTWSRQNIRNGWKPTDHVFLTVPALGRKHALQAHPFTIASAAPPSQHKSGGDDEQPVHCWLNLLIRAQKGFTADLLCYAHRHHRVSVRLDGPYGSSHALDMLRAADNAVLVAGGSGIAVTFPLVWALLMGEGTDEDEHNELLALRGKKRKQRVRMMWIVHSDEHRYWVPDAMLDKLVASGLDLVVPPSTAVAGRPDVVGTVEGWIQEVDHSISDRKETAVVVSGPDGLNRLVRNTCAEAIRRGADIQLAVEKFGW
ncbi:putative ferric reductase transmembrane component [Diaporthe ampelina]|uniref:Putative ferric reductase transmembrane component n=1 Tax=Diaporthe ampelina TaxID=1214573 RepID=A0A0G2FEP8_9PEZI|nr:putative ferric reductase transmembrane component [Diaporthe ampelina]